MLRQRDRAGHRAILPESPPCPRSRATIRQSVCYKTTKKSLYCWFDQPSCRQFSRWAKLAKQRCSRWQLLRTSILDPSRPLTSEWSLSVLPDSNIPYGRDQSGTAFLNLKWKKNVWFVDLIRSCPLSELSMLWIIYVLRYGSVTDP